MPFEPTGVRDAQVADASPRALPRPISYACALLLAAAAVVLLGTTDAAAADDLGGLVAETVESVEAVVVPAAPIDQPVAPIVEALEPVTGELPPIDAPINPIDPIEPITPIIDELLPIIEPLVPSVDVTLLVGDSPPGLELRHMADAERAAPQLTQDLAMSATADHEVSAGTHSTTPGRASADLPFDLPARLSSRVTAEGTTLVAALLIGLLMAVPTGWTVSAAASGMRPLSLAHSPPVPPG